MSMPEERASAPETRQLLALEACWLLDAKIRQSGRELRRGRREDIEQCQAELQHVIDTLQSLIAEGPFARDPALSKALIQLRQGAGALSVQITHASNLWSGWIQLRFGTGYTRQGLPLLTAVEGSTFEA